MSELRIFVHSFAASRGEDADDPHVARLAAGHVVDRATRRYQYAHPGTDYDEAMSRVLDADPALRRAYGLGELA